MHIGVHTDINWPHLQDAQAFAFNYGIVKDTVEELWRRWDTADISIQLRSHRTQQMQEGLEPTGTQPRLLTPTEMLCQVSWPQRTR